MRSPVLQRVRLEEVHPEEEAIARTGRCQSPATRWPGPPGQATGALIFRRACGLARHLVVIGGKAVVEAEAPDGAGTALTKAPDVKPAAERALASVGTLASTDTVVPGAVARRITSRHQRRVRGQRDWRRRERVLEADAARPPEQSIVGVRALAIAIGADAIGAQRIDRNEDEVSRLNRCRGRRRRLLLRLTATRADERHGTATP